MPRTPYGAINHESFIQWPVVMAAMCVDREHFRSAPDQHDFLLAHVTDELPINKVRKSGALRQVGGLRRGCLLCHVFPSIAPRRRSCQQTRLDALI